MMRVRYDRNDILLLITIRYSWDYLLWEGAGIWMPSR
jgi:hypothetical protein